MYSMAVTSCERRVTCVSTFVHATGGRGVSPPAHLCAIPVWRASMVGGVNEACMTVCGSHQVIARILRYRPARPQACKHHSPTLQAPNEHSISSKATPKHFMSIVVSSTRTQKPCAAEESTNQNKQEHTSLQYQCRAPWFTQRSAAQAAAFGATSEATATSAPRIPPGSKRWPRSRGVDRKPTSALGEASVWPACTR